MSGIGAQLALFFLLLIYVSARAIGHSPLASVFNLIVGISFAGIALQIVNSSMTTWSSPAVLWMTVGGAWLQFTLVCVCQRRLIIKVDRGRRIYRSAGEFLLFLSVVTLVLFWFRTVAFHQMIFAEDNAKWTNAAFFIEKGSTSSLVVNGLGAALFCFLSIVIAVLVAINQFLHTELPRTTLVVLSVWITSIISVGLCIALLCSGLKKSLRLERGLSLPNLFVILGVSLSCVLLLIQSQTFGFLTFTFCLVLTGLSARQLFEEDKPGVLNFFSSLVLSLNAAFVWLPLAVLLGPVIILSLLFLVRATWAKSRMAAVGVTVGTIVLGYPVLLDRIRYLFSATPSEPSVWRELLKSPGATPSVTVSMLVAGTILLGVLAEVPERRRAALYAVPAIGLSVLALAQVLSSSIAGDTSYTVQKLGVYTFAAVIIGIAQVRPVPDSGLRSVSLPTASLVCAALLVFGGDIFRTSSRILDTATQKTLTDENRYWIKEASNRLSAGKALPVGCVSITETGEISSDVQRDYFCTRALNGIAGGEERLIGLLAHSMGTFNADEMIGSLEHYLGTDQRETVMLLTLDGQVADVVPISELDSRRPNLFSPTSP